MSDVLNRRDALRALAGFLAGSPLLRAQQDAFRDHTRVPSIKELLNAFDFEAVAYAKQPRAAYDYRAYGADSEFTLRRNREAFEWVELVPRRLGGPAAPKTEIELLGTKMPFPLMVSPTALHGQLHPDAEQATHKGAAAASGTTMIVSNNSSLTFDKIAPAAPSPLWVQLYPKQQMDLNQQYIEGAQAAGASALVVTIDQQASVYERASHDRNLGGTPFRRTGLAGSADNPYRISNNRLWYEWKFFDDLRRFTKIPIMAKGIVTAEDAKLCVERGLDAVYVSNHGGRSLDYGPSTLEVLPEIVAAVNGKVPVIFDGGIRRGTDILKALALGASAVCIGRVPMWGLGSFGANGVQRVLEILQAELVEAMRTTGRTSLASIDKSLALTNFP
ncbi:MAG: alpha-hydroxy-acid oxidizing protein [Acidobacteriota bacterium]|nr:alpha-hydroxy-acid oxidizing protein [Acidobacteriota bacterium]